MKILSECNKILFQRAHRPQFGGKEQFEDIKSTNVGTPANSEQAKSCLRSDFELKIY
jgi:hypothetical protein